MTSNTLDPLTLPEQNQTSYPEPFAAAVAGRHYRRLGDALSLTQFGINFCRLEPGAWSSQRHWHEQEDEFIYVVRGNPTLITNNGRQQLRAGMVAGFKAGVADGHHLINETDEEVLFLVVGSRAAQEFVHYDDIDLQFSRDQISSSYQRKDGTPY